MSPSSVPTAIEQGSRTVPGGTRHRLALVDGEQVPAILLLPANARPVPAALLLHGYTSRKERMAESLGMALLRQGVASLSVDLPLHGEREVEGGLGGMSGRNPFELVQRWRLAMAEAGMGLRYLEAHPRVDGERLGLVGYSLGSYLAVMAAAQQPLARVICLAAGGDLPAEMPFGAIVRTVVDPARAVRKLAGRPLLMINGRGDRTIRPAQADRLFAAAAEPKAMRWYAGGHWPPVSEIHFAAEWVAAELKRPRVRRAGGR